MSYIDETTGQEYWYNSVTGETSEGSDPTTSSQLVSHYPPTAHHPHVCPTVH